MKLTHALLTLPLIAALETSTAHGQMERIVETDYRYTWRGNSPVKVQRRIKFDMLSLGYRDSVAKAEAEVLKTYPWTTLIVSENEFLYERNCHDFAWAPFMYDTWEYPFPSGPQKDAWIMGLEGDATTSPTRNWKDGSESTQSMKVGAVASRQGTCEYLFPTAALDVLRSTYITPEGPPIGFPVCDLNTLDDEPTHSAVLLFVYTPPEAPQGCSAGIFMSKWGYRGAGIFMHRWGDPFCPPIYCTKDYIRLFVPNWTSTGGYPIYHSYWGLD